MKKQIHLLFQIILICAALAGVVLEIIFQKGHNSGLNLLSYFTIQSNLIVAVALSLNIYYRANPPGWLAALKSGAAIWILVTGLVFIFFYPRSIIP